jgi:hypothetical protein
MVQKTPEGDLAWRSTGVADDWPTLAKWVIADFWPIAKVTLPEAANTEFETFVTTQLQEKNPNAALNQGAFRVPRGTIDAELERLIKANGSGTGPDADALASAKSDLEKAKAKVTDLDKKLSQATAKDRTNTQELTELRTALSDAQNDVKQAKTALEKAAEKTNNLQAQIDKAAIEGSAFVNVRPGGTAELTVDLLKLLPQNVILTSYSDLVFNVDNATVVIAEDKSDLASRRFWLKITLAKNAPEGVLPVKVVYKIPGESNQPLQYITVVLTENAGLLVLPKPFAGSSRDAGGIKSPQRDSDPCAGKTGIFYSACKKNLKKTGK